MATRLSVVAEKNSRPATSVSSVSATMGPKDSTARQDGPKEPVDPSQLLTYGG